MWQSTFPWTVAINDLCYWIDTVLNSAYSKTKPDKPWFIYLSIFLFQTNANKVSLAAIDSLKQMSIWWLVDLHEIFNNLYIQHYLYIVHYSSFTCTAYKHLEIVLQSNYADVIRRDLAMLDLCCIDAYFQMENWVADFCFYVSVPSNIPHEVLS